MVRTALVTGGTRGIGEANSRSLEACQQVVWKSESDCGLTDGQ